MTDEDTLDLDQLAAHLGANRFGIHDLLKDKPVTLTYDDLRRICLCCATTAVDQTLRLADEKYQTESKYLQKHGMHSNALDSTLQHIVTFHLRTAADWRREGNENCPKLP